MLRISRSAVSIAILGRQKKGCELKECYYLLPEEEPEETAAESACSSCPYGKVTPCIGYCLVKIMRE